MALRSTQLWMYHLNSCAPGVIAEILGDVWPFSDIIDNSYILL